MLPDWHALTMAMSSFPLPWRMRVLVRAEQPSALVPITSELRGDESLWLPWVCTKKTSASSTPALARASSPPATFTGSAKSPARAFVLLSVRTSVHCPWFLRWLK
jgi:hypothetical protein